MTLHLTPVSTNLYATVAALKVRLSITDTADDTTLGMILSGVCRAIDAHCGQHFYRDATATTRYYTAEDDDTLFTDPIVSITTLATDDGTHTYAYTWATTDYDLLPLNAAADGVPYRWLEVTPYGSYEFPCRTAKGVKIVGIFGWPAVPDAIAEAALLWSERLYKRKDAPFGVLAFPEAGEMRLLEKMDPDVVTLLKPFVRLH